MSNQGFWGPPNGISSKDYVLYMRKPNPLQQPYQLQSHTLGSVNQNLIDALRFNRTAIVNGRTVTKEIIGRAAEETSRDYTVGFPRGVLSTPAMFQALSGGCEADFYQVYLCPDNTCYEHFYALTDSFMDPPIEAEDPITVDDVVELYETTTLHTPTRLAYFNIFGYVLNTIDLGLGTGTLQAVHAAPEACPDCGGCVNRVFIGGNDGAAASETAYLAVSTDRGGSFTEIDLDTLTSGATTGLIVMDINTDGEYIWVALSDDTDESAATAGTIVYSTDGGTTFSDVSTATAPAYATFLLEGVPYVVGDGGEVWRALDGVTWEQVTQSVTTENLLGAAVDESAGVAYIVGTTGAALVFDGVAFVDLSSAISGLTPGDLYAAHILSDDRIQISGATGFIAESYDGGTTWTALSVTGSTDTIFALGGDGHRALAVQGANAYRRDVLSGTKYTAIDYQYSASITGDLTDISAADGVNYHFAVVDSGEVILFKPCGPDYCADIAAA